MTPIAKRLDNLKMTPAQLLSAWPADRPLALLCSGDGSGAPNAPASPWSRWSFFAIPQQAVTLRAGQAIESLGALWTSPFTTPSPEASEGPPFRGGWIGWFSYQLGRELEPASGLKHGPLDDRAWPLGCWQRCPAALAFDHHQRQWWVAGDARACDALVTLAGDMLPVGPRPWRLSDMQSRSGRESYVHAVERVVEYIHAGDIFQANIAHRLSAPFEGSARALMARLWDEAQPWYGAYIEHLGDNTSPHRTLLSISPELLAQIDPVTRRVVTRPMKGTRRDASPDAAADLAASRKDAAELNMIIDLMRNDLGRVCELGSVRVDEVRTIERHAARAGAPVASGPGSAPAHAILQGVATVSGTLRPGCSPAELLRAIFPAGSVTGAPKIRAMQIIEELEPVARGPYCGSIGYLSDTGHAALSVAIRTALITGPTRRPADEPGEKHLDAFPPGSTLDYAVGAGIVAASRAESEWQETLDKASLIRALGV